MNKSFGTFLLCFMVVFSGCLNASADSRDKLANQIFAGDRHRPRVNKIRSDYSPIPRKKVAISSKYQTGTIIVRTGERRLYHVTARGRALAYGIGVGKEGFTWNGSNRISRKAEWPGWRPPARMREREAKEGRILPEYMPGGPNNPLGARAMYIGSTMFRIHGTNQPWTIGRAMSSGCIRMANEDVKHLYANVDIGTKIIVLR
jgi:lipoprotein-anchoring transpeptidase ErfK/SrfK